MRRPSPYLIVFTLWLLVFSASSQIMILSPILPRIGSELDIPQAWLGTLVSAYSFMVGVFALIAGPISDRVGRRRILVTGSGAMTLALLAHYFVQGYFSFLAVRVLAGVAGGILSGAAVSYVGDYFPYHRRGWAVGWVMSGSAFGQILGIPAGVLLAGRFGFRAPFFLFAATMALTFLLIRLRLPQPPIPRIQEQLTLAAALQAYGRMLRVPGVAPAAGAYFLMFLGVSLYVVYFPTWLEETVGFRPDQVAGLFFAGGLANVLTGPQAGRFSDRVGRKKLVLASSLGLFAVMLLTTRIVREAWVAYPLFVLTMILVAMRISPFSALLTALVPDQNRGSLMALAVALGQVGYGLGGAFAGPFYSRLGFVGNTLIGGASVLGMGLVVWFLVPEPPGVRPGASQGGGELSERRLA